MDMIPVILAGGGGSRLWPLSRKDAPKQFVDLGGDRSLFRATILRMRNMVDLDRVRVVCGLAHRVPVFKELESLGLSGKDKLIPEPYARNTGPAILLAARVLASEMDDPILSVLPADHAIGDVDAFQVCMEQALKAAIAGSIATLGVAPDRAETGYGYIETESAFQGTRPCPVKKFVEKPDTSTAESYLKSGVHLWNAGIFVFRASVIIEEFRRYQPEIAHGVEAYLRGDKGAFAGLPSLSIDYAVMEYTKKAVVVPAHIDWNDLGNWRSIHEITAKDMWGNGKRGPVLLECCRGSYFRADHRLVVGLGVSDLVVIETADAVLVADKGKCQDVKKISETMSKKRKPGEKESDIYHRPWGTITVLGRDTDFKTKRLDILPGKRLSLQHHRHRTEYWVIVRGIARVTRNEEIFDLGPGETTVIPPLTKHRIENQSSDLLSLIEVQLGDYFGEDDIVRFEDDHGRATVQPETSLIKTE